jgi:hypothetical protein
MATGTAYPAEQNATQAPAMNDPENPIRAAIQFQNELLRKNWPDDRGVADLSGIRADSEARQYAARARVDGRLLGVWCATRETFLHPDFQFDGAGNLRPDVVRLLAVLPDEDDHGGWRRAFWLYSPHPLLHGQLPAEVFTRDPVRVLGVARLEFHGDRDDGW